MNFLTYVYITCVCGYQYDSCDSSVNSLHSICCLKAIHFIPNILKRDIFIPFILHTSIN